ncbi:Thymidine kinase [Toxocara canis]|uniref:Thymidine kinase, cytosolic n=1 Tax=Toxocara canis TaxID=6265 RepID=A0A0B2VJC1_TOXCA|nr:Thymidine kinase [Toxocara canis]
MLRRLNRYKLANRVCRIVKYRNDTRYSLDQVTTHDLQMQEAIGAVRVSDIMDKLSDAHVVAIDEGQFFDDIAECSDYLANRGKIVIVSALDGDFNRKRFKNILDLCPLSEDVIKLNAVCTSCGEDASYTKRLTSEVDLEVIGGRDMYTAMCRDCYFAASQGLTNPVSPLHGRLEVILGPMFSGKTQLMHDGIIAKTIGEIFDELLSSKVIVIDEGQFFPDIVECCERLANMGKIVIVAALDGDFNRTEFGNRVLDLCPLAEKVCKLRAVCTECGSEASFTKRLTAQKEQEIIGGRKTYRAMCRSCYLSTNKLENFENCPIRSPLLNFNSTSAYEDGLVASKRLKLIDGSVVA